MAATASHAGASSAFSLPGRRKRAAGERIAAFFEDHGRMVYGVCRLLLRDPVEAEDAAQQTFLSAYRALLAGQAPRDPSAWLGTIARNECRTRLRGRRTEPLTLVREPVGDELQRDLDRRAEIQALCSALAELPPQQRDAVVLREFYGLSYAEVGAALGLSGAAVESVLFRSRKHLQAQLRPARAALGALTLPLSLRDSLAQALPGFGGSGASAGAGAAALTKLASGPIAVKVAAATLAIGAAGTVAGIETTHVARHRRAPVPVRQVVAVRRAPAAVRARTTESVQHAAPVFAVAARTVHATTRPHDSGEASQTETETRSSGSGGRGEPEHHSGGTGSGDTTSGSGHDSGGSGSHDSGSGDSHPGETQSGDSGSGSDDSAGGSADSHSGDSGD